MRHFYGKFTFHCHFRWKGNIKSVADNLLSSAVLQSFS